MSERGQASLLAPVLLTSSAGRGWEGFAVHTYAEPRVMEQWRAPDSPALTLVLVTQGVMQVEQRRIDGPWEAYTLHPGDVFLRPPGRAPYELRWWAGSATPMRTLHLHVQPAFLRQSGVALGVGDPVRDEVIEQVGLRDPLLAQICGRLAAALSEPESIAAETMVQLVLAQILRRHTVQGSAAEQTPYLTTQQVQQVVAYVRENLDQPLTLADIAAHVGYSPYHFARLFRQAIGVSPYQFVLRERVDGAQHLLREGRRSLMDVALTCGFANQSHMTRIFRRHLGVPPGVYQRLVGVAPPSSEAPEA